MLWIGDRVAPEKTDILAVLLRYSHTKTQLQEVVMTSYSISDKPPFDHGFIYMIKSPKGKSYIGQTKCSVKTRLRHHASPKSFRCRHIHNAIMKYGIDNMTVSILGVFHIDELNDHECAAIKRHNTLTPNGYNLVSGGNARKRCSEETKKRMSIAKKGVPRPPDVVKKISKALKGKKQSPESVAARSVGIKKSWENPSEEQKSVADRLRGKTLSEEHKAKIRKAKENISEETRQKLSKALTGRVFTQEWCDNISKGKKGKRPTQTQKLLASYARRRKSNHVSEGQLT